MIDQKTNLTIVKVWTSHRQIGSLSRYGKKLHVQPAWKLEKMDLFSPIVIAYADAKDKASQS
jgi:hypothetical protein